MDALGAQAGAVLGRTRVAEVLSAEGLGWRKQEGWFGERVDPGFAEKSNCLRGQAFEDPSDSATCPG